MGTYLPAVNNISGKYPFCLQSQIVHVTCKKQFFPLAQSEQQKRATEKALNLNGGNDEARVLLGRV